jgi:multiple sugar transport system permease protein
MYIPKGAGRRSAAFWLLLPSLIGVVVFCLIPIASSLLFSLMDYDTLKPMSSMQFIGLKNFVRILTGSEFPKVLQHTFTYLILYLPLILLTSLIQGLLLNQTFKGRGLFRTVFYTPVITSWVAAAVVWQWVLSGKYGLMNQMLLAIGITGPGWLASATWAMPGIVLAAVWKDTGYYALMILAALKSIDGSYYEAAAIDGAGPIRRFFGITLPLISPTLFLLIIINVIYGLQVFDSVVIMTANSLGGSGGPGGATTVFLERIYKYAFEQYKMGMASAYSWVLFILILVFTAVQFSFQRKWVNYDA